YCVLTWIFSGICEAFAQSAGPSAAQILLIQKRIFTAVSSCIATFQDAPRRHRSIVPDRIPLSEVLAHVHDEGQGQVHNYGRPEREERCVYEEQSDAGGGDTELLAHPGADAERVSFTDALDSENNIIHMRLLGFQL